MRPRDGGQPRALLVASRRAASISAPSSSSNRRLLELRAAGCAILLVSVELDEIRDLADRILVMADGAIVGELPADSDERALGLLMGGIGSAAA